MVNLLYYSVLNYVYHFFRWKGTETNKTGERIQETDEVMTNPKYMNTIKNTNQLDHDENNQVQDEDKDGYLLPVGLSGKGNQLMELKTKNQAKQFKKDKEEKASLDANNSEPQNLMPISGEQQPKYINVSER